MKKVVVFIQGIVWLLFFYSCVLNDKDAQKIIDLPAPRIEMRIPTGIIEQGTNLKVSVMLSHQFYSIQNNEQNKVFIDLIRESIRHNELLVFYLKQENNKIMAVQKADKEQVNKFQSLFKKQSITSQDLPKVIPDEQTLNALFEKIKAEACTFVKSYPCISFDYPEDGCYARAHKMRKILADNGYDCEKQFIYGDLNARYGSLHPTKGGCCVNWSYHVSILVSYKNKDGQIQKCIMDPCLFPKSPIEEQQWREACLNNSCEASDLNLVVNTPSEVYYRSPQGTLLYDDSYKNTDCVLEIFSHVSGCTLPVPSTSACGF